MLNYLIHIKARIENCVISCHYAIVVVIVIVVVIPFNVGQFINCKLLQNPAQ